MINQQIDVSKIMYEIKARVQPEEEQKVDLWKKEGEFKDDIYNARMVYYPIMDIGDRLPAGSKLPKFAKGIARFVGRIVRKLNKFIIYDQKIVNRNIDVCVDTIVKREDCIMEIMNDEFRRLETDNKRLKNEILQNEKKIELLEQKIEKLMNIG